MPKRGGNPRGNYNNMGGNGGNSRFSALKDYQNEHDNRDRIRNKDRNTRRVSFKPSQMQGSSNIKNRLAEMAVRSRLEDDEDMGDFASTSKFSDREYVPRRRKGSPIPKGKFGSNRNLLPCDFGWYQVSIQNGQRYSKDDILRHLLTAIAPDTFVALYWRVERHCVIFFLDDHKIGVRLNALDRSVQMSDGQRLFIRVRGGCPMVSVDDRFKEKMKLVMAKRYNASTRALDLSKFNSDPDFKGMFCGLFRTPVMAAAVDIIEKNIPDLVALNLNDNCISSLEAFKNVAQRLPNLKILYLGDNKIQSMAHLLVLRPVPLVELLLKSNPLRQRYRDHSLYVSEVRKKFPKLMRLDGEDLEPPICFDLHDNYSLPQPKASFLCDTAGVDIVRQFLEQYFRIFDTDNRQPLLDAYHEQAMMSISVPPASQGGKIYSFWKYNRNLKRIMNNHDQTKTRQLKVGRLAVVSCFAELPRTQHDPQTFSVDLTLFTPKLICLTVAGLFKEFESSTGSSGEVRHFQRQMLIVPAGGGFCIRNELVYITSATHAQNRTFLRPSTATTNTAAPAPQMAQGLGAPGGVISIQDRLKQQAANASVQIPSSMLQGNIGGAVGGQPDDATKMQMVQAMSAQSNMNLEWSKKCLEETNWDYNHAAFVFDKLQKESKIPPEAFIK